VQQDLRSSIPNFFQYFNTERKFVAAVAVGFIQFEILMKKCIALHPAG
jgi:hypothetical protein